MNNRIVRLIILLVFIYIICFSSIENFADANTNEKKFNIIKIKNENYIMVAFSQLNNVTKGDLIKNNLNLFNSIFGSQFSAVVKFIENNNNLIPVNDPIFLIKAIDGSDLLTNKTSHIAFDGKGTPLYTVDGVSNNNNRKLSIKENVIILTSDSSSQSSSIDFKSNKIGNDFINAQSIIGNGRTLFLAKKGNQNENITF